MTAGDLIENFDFPCNLLCPSSPRIKRSYRKSSTANLGKVLQGSTSADENTKEKKNLAIIIGTTLKCSMMSSFKLHYEP